jgi:general secretion pathway protein L
MVPAWLSRRLWPVPGAILLDVTESGLVASARGRENDRIRAAIDAEPSRSGQPTNDRLAAIERLTRLGMPIHLRVDSRAFLRRNLTLPLDVEPTLRRALEFQVDSLTPFKRDDVHIGYRIDRRDFLKGELQVAVAVVPRERVAAALDLARRNGLDPDAVEASDDEAPIIVPLSIAQTDTGNTTERRARGPSLVLACLALLLLGAAIYIPIYRLEQHVDVLKAAIEQARENALATQRLREKLSTARDAGRFFAERKASGVLMIELMNEVTRRVPDGAWLNEMRVEDTTLFLSGFAASASSLLGGIEASPILSDAKFLSPVTREGKDNVERFEISTVVSRKAKP